MKKIGYSVKVTSAGEPDDRDVEYTGLTLREAKEKAEELAKEITDRLVFVTWYRGSDGCSGYYNRAEGHAPVGESWN